MDTTGYILNAVLIVSIVRQLRGSRLTGLSMLIPFGIVAYIGPKYLHSIPSSGNSLLLVVLGAGAGTALGVLCGLYSHVYRDQAGVLLVRASAVAAALWIVGVGARLAFTLYAEHGGGPSLVRFSAAHALSEQAWVAALILMALAEVMSRTGVLLARSRNRPERGEVAIMPLS